jgi:hypothetical protein
LEDEGVSVQGLEDWWGKEEVPHRVGGICSRVVATNISSASQSGQGMEEVQTEDRRSAGPGECGFLREKEMDLWRTAAGDPYPMEKNPDEILMFARFVECGLVVPASDFFKGLLRYYDIEYLNLNPNKIFHVSVFVHFYEAFVGIKPHWILFRKFFRVKSQPSTNDPRVVRGAGI